MGHTLGDIRARFAAALNETKQPSKKATYDFWLKGFKRFMKSNDFAGVSSRKGDTGEVLRANFGSNDGEAETNISKFIENIGGFNSKDYEIENLGVGPVSSDYAAYKIILNRPFTDKLGRSYVPGDFFVITNRYKVGATGEHSVIGKKDLTPDRLKITKNEYKSGDSLIAAVKPTILNKDYPENYKRFILETSQYVLDDSSNRGKFADFESYANATIQTIEYSVPSELFEGIDQLSVNNFQNDYGEILGGIAMFNLLKNTGTGLSYPTASNEKLVDFYFDGYSVSSKAGRGGTPTGDTVVRKINDLYEAGKIMPEGSKETDFFNNFILAWINAPKLSRSGTYDNIINLCAKNITDKKNSGFWFLSETTGIGPEQMEQSKVEDYLDGLYNNVEEFKSFISKLWDLSGLSWNQKMLDSYTDEYPKMGIKRVGVIFYPLMVEVVKELNNLYGEELTKFSQMATDVKQLYLDVNVKKSICAFKAVPFKTATFKFEQKGSMSNPFNSNMGIRILK